MSKRLLKFLIPTVAISLLIFSEAMGGGLALSGVGSRAISMGGAFRGLADDWSACYWNPAGLAWMDKSEFNGMLTIISPRPEYTPNITLGGYDILGYKNGTKWYTEDKNFNIPSFSGFFKAAGLKGWTAGLGIYVPYGTGAIWDIFDLPTGYNPNVSYPKVDHKSEFEVIDFHPTIARELIEGQLSFGVGLSIQRGSIFLQQVIWNTISPSIPVPYNLLFTDMQLDGDGWGVGANAGLMYKPNDKLSIGIAYRSPTTIKLDGTAKLNLYTPYNPGLVDEFNSYNTHDDSTTANLFRGLVFSSEPDAKADLKLPADYGIGIAYRPSEKLTLTGDINYTDWSRLDYVPIALEGTDPMGDPATNDTLVTQWESTVRFSLGLEYNYSSKLALRCGYFNDPSPIPNKTFTPTIPDIGDKNSFNLGFGYDLGTIRIDYNLEYIIFGDRDIPNLQDSNGDGNYDNYPGKYSMDLFSNFISITHRF